MKKMPAPYPGKMKNPGLYLHVPFCEKLCPFCPYNREKYDTDKYAEYEKSVHKEINLYAKNVPSQKYVSLYIGGGTPTINVPGLVRIIQHMKASFALDDCDICVEFHPSHMEEDCLRALKQTGVTLISIGVESTNDDLLKRLGRNHDGKTALESVRRAVSMGFRSVNVDLMFVLPGQTLEQLDEDLTRMLGAGIDQISTYPIFGFPYSEMGMEQGIRGIRRPDEALIRTMFDLIAIRSRESGFERCAVWSFLKPSRKKFSSITRHHYLGFGPSAASMIGDHFYVNTFSVNEYVEALSHGRPVALVMEVPKRIEMAYWLYWRVYEMRIPNEEFSVLFEQELEEVFGRLMLIPRALSMAEKNGHGYVITEAGAYWIHRIQNEYSLNYINRLWGRCRATPWPNEVIL